MKTLLSLFDYSGQWSDPFFFGGWNVVQVDIKFGSLHDLTTWSSVEYVFDELGIEDVDGIIAAVPCTDFAASGARWWKGKDITLSKHLVEKTLALVDLFEPTDPDWAAENPNKTWFWAIENPVGRIAKLYPELGAGWYFDPYEYAGWSTTKADLSALAEIRSKDGIGVTRDELDLIWRTGAYTKKTGLWGRFNRPEKRTVEPVKANAYGSPAMRYGGKSAKTKEARSNTPTGFAKAFYEANNNFNALNNLCHDKATSY